MSRHKQLFHGGRIFTANSDQPWAEALLVEGDTIAAVGGRDLLDSQTDGDIEYHDIDGGLVVPGFVDGHVHLSMTGASMLKAQLEDAGSLEEIQQRVRAWADAHPDAPRVLGTNWVHGHLPGGIPHRDMLDAIVSDRPVYLEAFDFHSCWVNSAALAELGIDAATPDPIGGQIVRDPDTGEATGYLLENASVNYVWALLNNVPAEITEQRIRTAMSAFCRAGITSIVDMAMEEAELDTLARLEAQGELDLRVIAHMIMYRSGDADAEIAQVKRAIELAAQHRGDSLRVTGIKFIADGTIDNCTAALSKPYTNGDNSGPIWDRDALLPMVAAADAAGLQVAIHAIGDATITLAVDAIEHAMRVNGTSNRRHRIEHLEYALQRDIDRMGDLGITASMQPVHVRPELLDNWKAMLGPERAEHGWAWPLYRAAGSTLAFGTDTPTAPYLPLINMYLASTRQSPNHPDVPALRPDWALPLDIAIESGTRESARAAWLEHAAGMLGPGLAADLVILDRDVIAGGPPSLVDAEVKLTMKAGKITHSA
jgi:predicted amidohydrolase YtcJ